MDERFFIRDYRAQDFAQVAGLWRDPGMGAAHRADTAEVIESTVKHGGRLLVMEERESGAVVGTSWLTCDGRRLYLHHFGVRPSHQGHGLSKPLLAESMRAAEAIGLQVKLEVHRDNVRAVNLYRNAGFLRLGDYDIYIIRDPAGAPG